MADAPSSDSKDKTSETPAPEVLKPQSTNAAPSTDGQAVEKPKITIPKRHGTYRPSHKATFIGLAVVVLILAINGGVIYFIMRGQSSDGGGQSRQNEVTLSSAALEELGVSRNPVGNTGTELVVGPNSKFGGTVTVAKDVSIAGQLKLNSKFSANEASLAKLEAGETSLGQLSVNGDGTITSLNLRRDLNVVGLTRLQGPVTVSQLLTVNNNLNVTGSLAVGGTLSVNQMQVNAMTTGSTLTVGGHIITRGSAPSVSVGPGVGSNGTVSISGSDAAGTIAVNTGVGAAGGIVATVSFRTPYSATPRVVVSGVGGGLGNVYVNRSATGFSVGVHGSIPPGGHAIDYIVMQ